MKVQLIVSSKKHFLQPQCLLSYESLYKIKALDSVKIASKANTCSIPIIKNIILINLNAGKGEVKYFFYH